MGDSQPRRHLIPTKKASSGVREDTNIQMLMVIVSELW